MWRSDHCQYYRLMWHIPHRKTMHRYAYCGAMQYWRLYLACGAETAILFLFHHEQIRTSGFYESDHDYCGKRHTATQTDKASGEKKTVKRWARCAILSTTNLLKLNWWFVKCRQCSDLFANIWSKLTKSQCSLFLIFVWLHFYEQKTKQGLLNLATSFDGILHSMVFKFAKRNLFCHL